MYDIDSLPPARGAFSRIKVVQAGSAKWLFVSGVAASVNTPPDAGSQTRIVFDIIAGLLNQHGASLRDIVKVTAFVADMADYDAYNAVRNELFSVYDDPPASSTVEARLVKPEFLVEVEAVALLDMDARA